jgi:two-component system nitrogen regulation response regulator GlnG
VIEARGEALGPDEVARVLHRLASTERPPDAPQGAPRTLREIAESAARAAEQQAIVDTLRATRGNKSQAARLLQTDYKTLHVKIRQLGISARDFE